MKTQTNSTLRSAVTWIRFGFILAVIAFVIMAQHNESGYPLIDLYRGLRLAFQGTFFGACGCLLWATWLVFTEEDLGKDLSNDFDTDDPWENQR